MNVKVTTDIGAIPRETITYLHVYLEQASLPDVKWDSVACTYKFYVGFKAEADEPSLWNRVLSIKTFANLLPYYAESSYSDIDDYDDFLTDVKKKKGDGGDEDDDEELSEEAVIAIAILFSLIGAIIIGVLVYCYCFKKDKPAMTERLPVGAGGFTGAP